MTIHLMDAIEDAVETSIQPLIPDPFCELWTVMFRVVETGTVIPAWAKAELLDEFEPIYFILLKKKGKDYRLFRVECGLMRPGRQ
ncbi:hypothetical protein [Bowdeniella nasicola]|nr:hypothetical protein [Bowdeniella nasicola]